MKKIITALSNKKVNYKLREYKDIEVVMNDIQYQEGIIEVLEEKNNIDFIILSELLPGEYELKELINKIKEIKSDIKIIVILEKENILLENYLFAKGNINVFYNNEIEIKEIVDLITNKKDKEDLQKEIQELKEIVLNKKEIENKKEQKYKLDNNLNDKKNVSSNMCNNEDKIIINENEKKIIEEEIEKEYINELNKNRYINRLINKFNNILKKDKSKKEGKIIIITGINGVGKSVFTTNIAKTIQKTNKKILIIDFDFFNNSIQILLGIKKSTEIKESYLDLREQKNNCEQNYRNKIEEKIIRINSKIDLLSEINLLENRLDKVEVLNIINNLKKQYDVILVDSKIKKQNNCLESLINNCDKIIFLSEANILQIKKTENICKYYTEKLNIKKEKIYILFNKTRKDSICLNILKEKLKNYNFIGKINFIKNINILINQNMKDIFLENKVKNQYRNIAKKILIDNKIKEYYLEKLGDN